MFRVQTAMVMIAVLSEVTATGQMNGINVLLNTAPSQGVLADLGTHGQVLDVISEIQGVTMRAPESEIPVIQALS